MKRLKVRSLFAALMTLSFLAIPLEGAWANPSDEELSAPSAQETRSFTLGKGGEQGFEFFEGGRLRFDPEKASTAHARSAELRSRKVRDGVGVPIEIRRAGFAPSDYPAPDQRFTPHGEVYHFEPEGMEFSEPALLTLPYESMGGDDSLIEIFYYNKDLRQWEIQRKVAQDLDAKTVTVEIDHFSDYVAGMTAFRLDEAGNPGRGAPPPGAQRGPLPGGSDHREQRVRHPGPGAQSIPGG